MSSLGVSSYLLTDRPGHLRAEKLGTALAFGNIFKCRLEEIDLNRSCCTSAIYYNVFKSDCRSQGELPPHLVFDIEDKDFFLQYSWIVLSPVNLTFALVVMFIPRTYAAASLYPTVEQGIL